MKIVIHRFGARHFVFGKKLVIAGVAHSCIKRPFVRLDTLFYPINKCFDGSDFKCVGGFFPGFFIPQLPGVEKVHMHFFPLLNLKDSSTLYFIVDCGSGLSKALCDRCNGFLLFKALLQKEALVKSKFVCKFL